MLRMARAALRPATMRMYSTNAQEINAAQKSYRPKGYEMSEGFRRARQQYAVSNFIIASAIASFVAGVYAYTILKVRDPLTRLIKMISLISRMCAWTMQTCLARTGCSPNSRPRHRQRSTSCTLPRALRHAPGTAHCVWLVLDARTRQRERHRLRLDRASRPTHMLFKSTSCQTQEAQRLVSSRRTLVHLFRWNCITAASVDLVYSVATHDANDTASVNVNHRSTRGPWSWELRCCSVGITLKQCSGILWRICPERKVHLEEVVVCTRLSDASDRILVPNHGSTAPTVTHDIFCGKGWAK